MIVVPALYHEAPEEDWPFSISINTVIALLTTLMRATMLVAVAEVIGQMKWRFFDDQQRPLSDLQHFDHASRGVLGSAKIIWFARSSFLTVVAALVMVTSVAVGPFTQQAVRTVPCSQTVSGVNASLPISHFVPGGRDSVFRVGAGMWQISTSMKGAMVNGLVNPTSNDNRVQAICETGNCTFPSSSAGVTHSSIGMCSSCFDTTNLISVQDLTGTTSLDYSNYTLPNNQLVRPADGYWFSANTSGLGWAEKCFPRGFEALASAALANVTIMSLTQAPCTRERNGTILCPRPVRGFSIPKDPAGKDQADVMAVSCALYPCLRNYHAEVTRGTLIERIVSMEPAVPNDAEARSNLGPSISLTDLYVSGNRTSLQLPCFVDGVEYGLSNISQVPHADMTSIDINGSDYRVPETCLYKVAAIEVRALQSFLMRELLEGDCFFGSSTKGVPICEKWWLVPLYNDLAASFDTVSNSMEQLATAITTQFRIMGTSNQTFYNKGYREAIIGSVMGTTVCTRFDWQWVLLPITLVFATATLLIIAVAQSWTNPAMPVWKTSILPLLFYNKVRSSHDEGLPTLDLDELQKVAETTKAKFQTRPDARIKGDFME
ncbi:hypothetical protein RB213_013712 [Colletotrichum asianum]